MTQITKLTRIYDDVASQIDERNLVWELAYLKQRIALESLVNIITKLESSIKTLILKLNLNQSENKFVEKIAFFYLEYLKT